MKIEINPGDRQLALLLIFTALVVAISAVTAYNAGGAGGVPATMGHSVDEMDWTNPLPGDLYVSGDVGIGTTSPDRSLDIRTAGGTLVEGIELEHGDEGSVWGLGIMGSANSNPGSFTIEDTSTTKFLIDTSGNVGIGTTDPGAKLEVSSTTSGFLPPRMTTAQMNAISSPPAGLMIYNNETNLWMGHNGTGWTSIGGGGAEFGTWQSRSAGRTYGPVPTDGVVSAYTNIHGRRYEIRGYTNGVLRVRNLGYTAGVTFPVKKGETWEVRGDLVAAVYWISLGN